MGKKNKGLKNRELQKLDDMQGKENADEGEETYMSLGICLGLCFGITIGQMVFHNLATGMSTGMCIGMAIGACIKRKK